MSDLYSAATIFCGHVGPEIKSYPEGTKTKHRGQPLRLVHFPVLLRRQSNACPVRAATLV